MTFDARAARLLKPGEHLTSPDYPGLRLSATASTLTWVYRYRSPLSGALRQVKIGRFPETSIHAAVVAWEGLRRRRDAGEDPAQETKDARDRVRAQALEKKRKEVAAKYRVKDVAMDYWAGHVDPNRAPKGSTEVKRMFEKMLGDIGGVPAIELTRGQAFDLIKDWSERAPVQAGRLRAELGAAWEYAYDSGKLEETCPNWWKKVGRAVARSRGKKIAGEHVGTAKRVLTPQETGALIRWLPNFSRLVADVLTIYLWTGTRGAEIVGMRGCELFDEADGVLWWVVPAERTKVARNSGAIDLRVPLFGRPRLIAERRRELYGPGPLFPAARIKGEPRPIEQKTIQSTVWMHQPYSTTRPEFSRPRLTVSHWAPHDLRRTARTMLTAMGCPANVAEAIVGHLPGGIVGTYDRHTYDAERALWLKRLDDRLEELAASSAS